MPSLVQIMACRLGQRRAIIWSNAGIVLIGPLGTNFSEISIEIHTFSFKKMHLKMSSTKWRSCCPGLYVLRGFSAAWSHNALQNTHDAVRVRSHLIYICTNQSCHQIDKVAFFLKMSLQLESVKWQLILSFFSHLSQTQDHEFQNASWDLLDLVVGSHVPHQRSYSHQARTVKQSSLGLKLVGSFW